MLAKSPKDIPYSSLLLFTYQEELLIEWSAHLRSFPWIGCPRWEFMAVPEWFIEIDFKQSSVIDVGSQTFFVPFQSCLKDLLAHI